ncbi:MAG: c-type cytochrome [Archangium sp.]|nr:c-type cytochrome [Archangium sp.]
MGRAGWMMVFAVLGCATPKAAETTEPKPTAVVEPVKTEPVVEPVKAEPVAEPVKAEPVAVAEPLKTEPVKAEPVKTEPVKTEPVKTTPVKAEPVKAEPVKTEPVKAEPAKVAEPDKKIERVWKAKCGSCHGADGKAATTKGKKMKMNDLSTRAWQASKTDAQIKKVINDGVKEEKDGVTKEMDGYSDLGAEQLEALVKYVRWLGPH